MSSKVAEANAGIHSLAMAVAVSGQNTWHFLFQAFARKPLIGRPDQNSSGFTDVPLGVHWF